jgi:hypothetical protein
MGSSLLQSRPEELMPSLSSLVKQLKKERDRVAKQLSGMDAALSISRNLKVIR